MKNQRIPEHELNNTATAGEVVENMESNESSISKLSGSVETKETHTNEAK